MCQEESSKAYNFEKLVQVWLDFAVTVVFYVVLRSFRMRLIVIDRPPYSTTHPVTTSTFFADFTKYLETIIMWADHLLIVRDFHIHADVANDLDGQTFLELLQSMDLLQHVTQRTHMGGHTLD